MIKVFINPYRSTSPSTYGPIAGVHLKFEHRIVGRLKLLDLKPSTPNPSDKSKRLQTATIARWDLMLRQKTSKAEVISAGRQQLLTVPHHSSSGGGGSGSSSRSS